MANKAIKHPQLWVIRHIPSGKCIPEPSSVGESRYTWVEPSDTGIPRLFRSEDSAKRALTQWLRGRHHLETDIEDDCEWGKSYEVVVGTYAEPVSTREREEMEVVPVFIRTSNEE